MSNNFHSMRYGCTVYGDATLAVESGICDAVAFEIQNSEGEQVAAVMLDHAHVRRIITQLQALVNEEHPGNKAAEQCAYAAWYLYRFSVRGARDANSKILMVKILIEASPETIVQDACRVQELRRSIADAALGYFVGGRV